MFFYGAANINMPGTQQGTAAGTINWVRNGLGDFSLNNAAGVATFNLFAQLADLKRPYITFPNAPGLQGTFPTANEFGNAFGTAAGGPSNPVSGGATITGATFETPNWPAGIAIIDIFAVYSVQTAALTTATLGLNRTVYTENAAFTNTAVVAATGIATTTTTGAGTPHVQKVSLAQPLAFETNDASDLLIELVITTAATSAIRVYGLGCHVAVQYV